MIFSKESGQDTRAASIVSRPEQEPGSIVSEDKQEPPDFEEESTALLPVAPKHAKAE